MSVDVMGRQREQQSINEYYKWPTLVPQQVDQRCPALLVLGGLQYDTSRVYRRAVHCTVSLPHLEQTYKLPASPTQAV